MTLLPSLQQFTASGFAALSLGFRSLRGTDDVHLLLGSLLRPLRKRICALWGTAHSGGIVLSPLMLALLVSTHASLRC